MHMNHRRGVWGRMTAQALCLVVVGLIFAPQVQAQQELSGLVNINEAPVKQLALLPGIGIKKATRIVTYRGKHKFKRTVELARVKGIGLKTVRKLKSFLRVQGPSTLRRVGGAPKARRP
jgi:competence ComEA-like helix-hairpin-helix protein